jgi:MFS family permease
VTAAVRRTFTSLRVPNYRRYFAGQVVSISGNWMQMVAEMWLVVTLTHSGLAVGIAPALQFLPILLFGGLGGVLADRMAKRRLLMMTQAAMAIPALTLWGLTLAGSIDVWMVYALVLCRGAVTAIDNPARQSFVSELVGRERTVNAIALNSVLVHTSRIVGPAAAGAVIAGFGVGTCFLINALTFVAMLYALYGMDPQSLHSPKLVTERRKGELRLALRYVRSTPALWIPLAMMALVGTLSFNFQVLLPLFANFTWHGTAETYALLTASMAVGSVCGALLAGARGWVSARLLVVSSFLFGVLLLAAAAAPTLPLQIAALVPMGAVSVTFASGVNSTLQLEVSPEMRGRVMALYSVVFLGSTPIGSPFVGWLAEIWGPRAGLVAGAAAALVAAVAARAAFTRAGQLVASPRASRRAPGAPLFARR